MLKMLILIHGVHFIHMALWAYEDIPVIAASLQLFNMLNAGFGVFSMVQYTCTPHVMLFIMHIGKFFHQLLVEWH